ncbi:hypothetical protein B0H19DRAFT_517271 [Mycena capillaripes]|nr:hypothetical protein B0H19DRAFT_517271 [Mycena capillaripes]
MYSSGSPPCSRLGLVRPWYYDCSRVRPNPASPPPVSAASRLCLLAVICCRSRPPECPSTKNPPPCHGYLTSDARKVVFYLNNDVAKASLQLPTTTPLQSPPTMQVRSLGPIPCRPRIQIPYVMVVVWRSYLARNQNCSACVHPRHSSTTTWRRHTDVHFVECGWPSIRAVWQPLQNGFFFLIKSSIVSHCAAVILAVFNSRLVS